MAVAQANASLFFLSSLDAAERINFLSQHCNGPCTCDKKFIGRLGGAPDLPNGRCWSGHGPAQGSTAARLTRLHHTGHVAHLLASSAEAQICVGRFKLGHLHPRLKCERVRLIGPGKIWKVKLRSWEAPTDLHCYMRMVTTDKVGLDSAIEYKLGWTWQFQYHVWKITGYTPLNPAFDTTDPNPNC